MNHTDILKSYEEQFGGLTEPRNKKGLLHPLKNIVLIAMLRLIYGADEFTEIEEFGKAKLSFLKKLFPLANRRT